MKNKIFIILTTIIMIAIVISGCKSEKTIRISNIDDLKSINTNYKSKNTYLLTNDINLKGVTWEPINEFYGTFDGNNHRISGLVINQNGGGLFNSVQGTIKNLSIDGKINASYSGMIAGRLDEDGLIENCKSYGEITGEKISYVGGLIGTLVNGTINNCINYAYIEGTTKLGGIVGDSWSKFHNVTISNCKNYGNIIGYNYVGGIVGNVLADATLTIDDLNTYGDKYTYITDCENNGKIIATDDFVGGIAGYVSGTDSSKQKDGETITANGYIELTNLTNKADVEGVDSVGGIVGHEAKWVTKFDNCENTGNVKGINYIGGVVGRNRSRQLSNLTNKGKVEGNNYVGGIAGETSSIIKSKNYGEIIGSKYIGGIAGSLFGETDSSDLENHGNINATGSHIGGIVGYGTNSKAILKNSDNYGTIVSTSTSYINGIMGYQKNITIENCHDYSKENK